MHLDLLLGTGAHWGKGGGIPLPYTITFRPKGQVFIGRIRIQFWVEMIGEASMVHLVKKSA